MTDTKFSYLSPPEFHNIFDSGMARMLFIGNSGSGKTYTLVEFIKDLKGFVDCLYIINPTLDMSLRTLLPLFPCYEEYDKANDQNLITIINNIKANLKKYNEFQLYSVVYKRFERLLLKREVEDVLQLIPSKFTPKEAKLLHKYNYESPDLAFEDFKFKHRPPLSFIIIDDSVGSSLFRGSRTTPLTSFFIKSRHYNTNFAILSQYLKAVPKVIRSNNNYFLLWRTFDSTILKSLYEECNSFISFDKFCDLFKQATADRYGFLFIDCKNRQVRSGLYDVIFSF